MFASWARRQHGHAGALAPGVLLALSVCSGATGSSPNPIPELTGGITPGDGEASRVVRRVRPGDMPPLSSSAPRIPQSMIERVAELIDNLSMTALPENTEQL
jgi:hypothetical protein